MALQSPESSELCIGKAHDIPDLVYIYTDSRRWRSNPSGLRFVPPAFRQENGEFVDFVDFGLIDRIVGVIPKQGPGLPYSFKLMSRGLGALWFRGPLPIPNSHALKRHDS